MPDLDRVAMLLHLEEKLRGHPHLSDIKAAVDNELKDLAKEFAPEQPEPIPSEPAEPAEEESSDSAPQRRLP